MNEQLIEQLKSLRTRCAMIASSSAVMNSEAKNIIAEISAMMRSMGGEDEHV